METFKRFTWEVIPLNTPLLKKKCSKCRNSNLYYCSDKFRLNSQKKRLDVWLVYKCTKCDDTCNITILSRTRQELIGKELYQKFNNNDEKTAWKYAFDIETFRKNSREADYNNVEYNIIYEPFTLEEISCMEPETIEFEIKTEYELDMRLTTLIKKCLNLSSGQLEKLLNANIFTISSPVSVKKCRVKDRIKVFIHKKELDKYLNKNP